MTCEFLLLNGANINCVDLKGFTPLHLSIETGNTALAYLLLKHKAKYDLTTNDGKLPIDFAVASAVKSERFFASSQVQPLNSFLER